MADYKAAGGICRGSDLDVNWSGLKFPVSNQNCELYNPKECECTVDDFYNGVCTYEEMKAADCHWWEDYHVKLGLCSEKTKELLKDQLNCIRPLYGEKISIYRTARSLAESMWCEDLEPPESH